MLLSDLVTYKNDCISIDSTLNDAIDRMGQEGISHVIVVENDSAIGILTLKNIIEFYRNGTDGDIKAIDVASYPVLSIHNDRPVEMAIELMIDYDVRRLVLIDEKENYISTLLQSDILTYYENKVHTAQEVFQCLNRRNRAVSVHHDASILEAINLLQSENRDVLIVLENNTPVGIVTEQDVLELAYREISSSEPIARYMHFPIITVEMNEKVHDAIDMMRERGVHHLMVKGRENDMYLLSEKDLVLNYNTALEVKLESKLRDTKATYNLLGLAFCEIIDLGEQQIIKWLNAEAMMTFQVKIDDCVSKMFPDKIWQTLLLTLRTQGGVDKEKIEINDRVYEVTLIEAEVNNQPIMKLFLNDISELVRLGEELRKTMEYTIELEQEKSRLYLDVASVMFLALNKEGKVDLINPKGCQLLGITQEDAIGKDWFETFTSNEDREMTKTLFADVVSGKRDVVEYYENKVYTKEGNTRVIAWHNALLKDRNGEIIGTFSSGEDITKIRESEREIERVTHYDVLTNLPNRLLLGARLEHSMQRAKREKTKVAVLYVDIDNFKDINESYGYNVGDLVIKRIASGMRTLIRQEDTISRVGGDEFVIILEEIEEISQCERTLNQIMHLFKEPIDTSFGDLKLTASIGITIYPDDAEDGETLLKNADIALRRAKESGQNSYYFYTQEMSVQLFERVLMERELHRAVEEKEFIVYYQPQIDLKSGKVIGAEALVRWQHPSIGIVRPDMFILLAESNRLIIPIGEQVLAQACAAVKRLIEQGLFKGRISVNVSGKQFERPDVVETIHRIITESTLAPEFVELEITESVLMSDPKELGEKLIALKALGIEVAIDDFGTGYSSLSYLKSFSIDKLKIDQSFVRGIPSDEQDSAIVKAIIAMAHALGLTTIAEGIEDEIQASALKECGCQQGQGYIYARPLSEEKFEEFLKYNDISKS
ncbi:EAL domain-containing protein [Sulfuricurvum sp.]|uniref:EAL domain-containing protein n=1 Tax=Sulfuricurvum sp. TaxID=2025608 RepID=UPI00260C1A2C|nr:EAL domain-containing protein [Sulfuricurvum sp.]MDD2265512.1 EAL domain-containing protein [Sulfuricurvum sp.]MDD2783380.1 EAL domain-containing protein [Sulfuricurvum sp.]